LYIIGGAPTNCRRWRHVDHQKPGIGGSEL